VVCSRRSLITYSRKLTFNLDIKGNLVVSPLHCDKFEHSLPESFEVFKGRSVADIKSKSFRHLFVGGKNELGAFAFVLIIK
jgi:hypothetical protein